jgi:hypothetical protein
MEEEKLGHAALVEDGLLHRRIHHLTEEKQRSKIARSEQKEHGCVDPGI